MKSTVRDTYLLIQLLYNTQQSLTQKKSHPPYILVKNKPEVKVFFVRPIKLTFSAWLFSRNSMQNRILEIALSLTQRSDRLTLSEYSE